MTIPASLLFGGLGRTDHYLLWTDQVLPSKTTASIDREAITRAKTALLQENWNLNKEDRSHPVLWTDQVLPSKTTALFEKEFISRDKTAAFTENFPAPSTQVRASEENLGDTLMEDIFWATDTITMTSTIRKVMAEPGTYTMNGAQVGLPIS